MSSLLTPAPFKTRRLRESERRYFQRRRTLAIRRYRATFFPQLVLGILLLLGFGFTAIVNWGFSWQFLLISGGVAAVSSTTMYPEYLSYFQDRKRIEQILDHGTCQELQVQATQVWEYEPSKDCGACYAFEQDNCQVIVVQGWEFFDQQRFPNSDFLLVQYAQLDSIRNALRIVRRGDPLEPSSVCEECLDLPCEKELAYCFSGDLVQLHQFCGLTLQ